MRKPTKWKQLATPFNTERSPDCIWDAKIRYASTSWNYAVISTQTLIETRPPLLVAQWIDDNGDPILPLSEIDSFGSLEVPSTAESLRELSEWCSNQVDKAREVEAAPGPRFGHAGGQPQRTGSREDVVTAIWLNPAVAAIACKHGEIFDPPLSRLHIDASSLRSQGRSCSWQATVRTGRYRTRSAVLRIDPSPSGVFTILQLVPERGRLIRSRSFIAAGVPAIDQLSNRLAKVLS